MATQNEAPMDPQFIGDFSDLKRSRNTGQPHLEPYAI
jgi:hypothetical protein